MKIYGPYIRKDGRKHIIKCFRNGKKITQSYPRYLMEKHLKRELLPTEEIDHIDHDYTNNHINNYELVHSLRKIHPYIIRPMFNSFNDTSETSDIIMIVFFSIYLL